MSLAAFEHWAPQYLAFSPERDGSYVSKSRKSVSGTVLGK